MSDLSLQLLALVVIILGMSSLALSIAAHWRQVFHPRPLSSQMRSGMRIAGAGLLAVAFFICAAADPVMMAVLVWPMLILVGAACVAAGLTLHAQMRSTTNNLKNAEPPNSNGSGKGER